MGNGHSQLKKVAGEVTLSNDQDGVAAAINSIILPAAEARRAV
ncbi:MAG TPA: Cof-type HAD-IIB family hydrolase, partial [Firmicutes bacterium]|nr:Cof-type HAD-IIB family hydrolase [Bacillota bacterium]